MATAGLGTLVDWHVLYPKGNETTVSLSRDNPGPFPCPGGDIIGPFGSFPPPAPGTNRWYRLKGVYFDGNAAGENNIQVTFNMFSTMISATASPGKNRIVRTPDTRVLQLEPRPCGNFGVAG